MNNLAWGYQAAGKLDLALPLFEETLKAIKAKLGPDHPNTLTTMNSLGDGYIRAGQAAKAEPLLRECLAFREKIAARRVDNVWHEITVGRRAPGPEKVLRSRAAACWPAIRA